MSLSPAYELGGLLKRNCDSSIPLKDEFAFVFAQDCTRSTFSPKDQAERTEKQRIAALKEDSLLDHALFYCPPEAPADPATWHRLCVTRLALQTPLQSSQ